jgi:hypothetical protein
VEDKPSDKSGPSTATRSSDDTKMSDGGGGGGGGGEKKGGGMPEMPGSQMQIVALVVTAGECVGGEVGGQGGFSFWTRVGLGFRVWVFRSLE